MGKLSLATKLADELGSSTDEAIRWIDEVGADTARATLDEAAEAGSRTVQNWWKPTAGVGLIGGGGALAWRQQELDQAEAIASQQQGYSSAAQAILASDLSPEAKQKLLQQLNQNAPASQNGGGGGGGNGGDGGGSSLLPGDAQTTIILVIVMVFVLKFTLEGDD